MFLIEQLHSSIQYSIIALQINAFVYLYMEVNIMASSLIQIRLDDELKAEATALYDALGIDLNTAVRMFIKRSVMVNGIPFSIVFTKIDKGKQREVEANIAVYKKRLLETWEELPTIIKTSSVTHYGKDHLLTVIEQINPLFEQKEIK